MTKEQKQKNAKFFSTVLSMTKEGGIYAFPAEQEIYTVKGRKFYGSKRGVRVMKEITPKTFHKNILIKTGENNE